MYACFYDVPGNEDIYARVKSQIGEQRPDGLVVQVVSKLEEGGLRHLVVWESAESWQRFQREQVQPAVATVLGDMGITESPPRPTVHEIDLVDVVTAG